MGDLRLAKLPPITIQSHRGPYRVDFVGNAFEHLAKALTPASVLILDANVCAHYRKQLDPLLTTCKSMTIEATEAHKDLDCFSNYALKLTEMGVRRDHTLVAFGGGIIQDITCFLAATMFRGMRWMFYPTTLLAQADSCIGSKSSINVGGIKNLMGTFTPPAEIFIDVKLLKTLSHKDVLSGVGEMIKVHGIGGIEDLQKINRDYEKILASDDSMAEYIHRSLLIKKRIIEQDEFDTGIRNVMNYGHTFGHAVESATDYGIPHGIAITIGQVMACQYALSHRLISDSVFQNVKSLLLKNFGDSTAVKIDFERFMTSIRKDKKNVGQQLALIIPVNDHFKIEKRLVNADQEFIQFCQQFFVEYGFTV